MQASTLYSPARPQACPPRTFRLWGLSPLLADASAPPLPRSISSYAQLGAGLAAFGSPPPGRCKYLFPPRGPRRGHLPASLPPSLPAGTFPSSGTSAPGRGSQEAKPLLMLFRGAPLRPPAPPGLFPALGRPPSAPAQCPAGGGAQIPVSGGGGGGGGSDRQFSLRRSTKRTRWLSPSLSPP